MTDPAISGSDPAFAISNAPCPTSSRRLDITRSAHPSLYSVGAGSTCPARQPVWPASCIGLLCRPVEPSRDAVERLSQPTHRISPSRETGDRAAPPIFLDEDYARRAGAAGKSSALMPGRLLVPRRERLSRFLAIGNAAGQDRRRPAAGARWVYSVFVRRHRSERASSASPARRDLSESLKSDSRNLRTVICASRSGESCSALR